MTSSMRVIVEERRDGGAGTGPAAGLPIPVTPIVVARGDGPMECARELARMACDAAAFDDEGYRRLIADSQRPGHGRYRSAVVASHARDLAEQQRFLETALAHSAPDQLLRSQGVFLARADARPRVAACFPGVGPQYPEMLRQALRAFPALRRTLDEIDDHYVDLHGRRLSDAFLVEHEAGRLQRDEDVHGAVFAVDLALFRFLEGYGLHVDAVVGEGAGEIVALVAAGVMSLRDGLRAAHGRSGALLSPAGADGRQPFRELLEGMRFAPPRCEVVSTITGASIADLPPSEYPALLAGSLDRPADLRRAVEKLHSDGIRLFVECGPRWSLTRSINQILGDRDHTAQAALHPDVGETEQLHRALACLSVHGAIDLRAHG